MGKNSGWWNDFFLAFRPAFGMIAQKTTNAQLKYIIKKLNLKPGMTFLDCPCGIGRIAVPMARKGIKVTGVDIIPSYLAELGKRASKLGLKINLVECDMRRIEFKNRFDSGANLWTSFGFFEKESDNLLVLKKMYEALKPGGKFLLHVINRDWIMANYSSTDWFEVANVRIFESRDFDYATSINKGVWRFLKNGVETSHHVNIRMYSYHELITEFKRVGFIDIQGYGSLNDDPITRDRRMMFVIGTKPKSPR